MEDSWYSFIRIQISVLKEVGIDKISMRLLLRLMIQKFKIKPKIGLSPKIHLRILKQQLLPMMRKNPRINKLVKDNLTRMQARKNLSFVAIKIVRLIQTSLMLKYRNGRSRLAKDNVFIDLINNNKTLKRHTVANVIRLVQVNQILVFQTKRS